MLFETTFSFELNSANPKHFSLLENLLAYSSNMPMAANLWNEDFQKLLSVGDLATWDLEKQFTWRIIDNNILFVMIYGEMEETTAVLIRKIFEENFGGTCLIWRQNEDEQYE